MLSAFVLIKAEPAQIASLADALTEVDGVAQVYWSPVTSTWS